MKARSFLALCAVTVVAVAVTVFARSPAPPEVSGIGEKLFPDLAGRLDQVAALKVEGPDGTVTLELGDGGWVVREREGHPASFEKIRAAVLGLLEAERAEAKTNRPDGFVRLGVADPGSPQGAGREIALLDRSGTPIARLLVGKTVHGIGGETSAFVRVPGEERAWLARGALAVGSQPRDWIERRLLDIPAGDIARLHVVRADGSTLTVVRDAPNSAALRLEELPKGKRLKRPEGLLSLISALSPLDIDDVASVASAPASSPLARIELVTFDGRMITVTVTEHDGTRWLRVATPGAADKAWRYQVASWKIEPLLRPLEDLMEEDLMEEDHPAAGR